MKIKRTWTRLGIMVAMVCVIGLAIQRESDTNVYVGRPNGWENPVIVASTPHSPISINGDTALDSFFSGNSTMNGTAGYPYLMENFEIDCGGTGTCIEVRNTNKYIIIKNCTLVNAYANSQYGVYIYRCSNVTVLNCTVKNCYYGISLEGSGAQRNLHAVNNEIENVTIWPMVLSSIDDSDATGNTINGGGHVGLFVSWCDRIAVSNNHLMGVNVSSVRIQESVNVTASGNRLDNSGEEGIFMQNSANCTLLNNTIQKTGRCGIYLSAPCHGTRIINNTITNAGASSFPYGINFFDSNYTTIEGNRITNSYNSGIRIWNANGTTIRSNHVYKNNDSGIVIGGSYYCTVEENFIEKNIDSGIEVYGMHDTTFRRNVFVENAVYSVSLTGGTSIQNTFFLNTFASNFTSDVFHQGGGTYSNDWDNGSRGNYWSNYTDTYPAATHNGVYWNTPYNVYGDFDDFPLADKYGRNFSAPIIINDDGDLDEFCWGLGTNGSQDNPHVIEGFDINAKGGSDCIYVSDVTLHFIIRNCTVRNASQGVRVRYSNHAVIENSTAYNCTRGIQLYRSAGATVQENDVSYCTVEGIHLYSWTNDTMVYHNSVANCSHGITIQSLSNWNTLINNTIVNATSSNNYGVSVGGNCWYFNITGNTINNTYTGISLQDAHGGVVEYNVVSNSVVHGVNTHSGASNTTIYKNSIYDDIYGVYIGGSSTEFVVMNNSIHDGLYGVHTAGCTDNEIINNTIYNHSATGINLYSTSSFTAVQGNEIYSGTSGITFYETHNNTAISNHIHGVSYAFNFGSSAADNTAYLNDLSAVAVTHCLYSTGSPSGNALDNGTRGNYWSNYLVRYSNATNDGETWSIPYQVSTGVADNHPLCGELLPVASFSSNATLIVQGQSVQFYFNGVEGNNPMTYTWDFDDGSPVSNDVSPVHQFILAGNFSVNLTVVDADGDNDTASVASYIDVIQDYTPLVSFIANVTEILTGESVMFTPSVSSGNPPLNWTWDFGDGSPVDITQGTVTHAFSSSAGSPFTVTLTITDKDYDTASHSVNITVADDVEPVADFTANTRVITAGETVRFSFTGTPGNLPMTYQWDFGDGSPVSNLASPEHVYANPGLYTVTLTVVDSNGNSSQAVQTGFIEVKEAANGDLVTIVVVIIVIVAGVVGVMLFANIQKKKKLQGTPTRRDAGKGEQRDKAGK